MKSKNIGLVSQIEDLRSKIEQLDQLISMHRKAGHVVEVKQFESMKLGFVKDLLTLLINSKLNLSEPQTFPLVYRLLQGIYPESLSTTGHSPEYMAIESALLPFLHKIQDVSRFTEAAEPDVTYGN